MYLTNVWSDVELINDSNIGCVIRTYEKYNMAVYDYNLNPIKNFKETNDVNERSLKQSVLSKYLFESLCTSNIITRIM